jgi:hypothetical protein
MVFAISEARDAELAKVPPGDTNVTNYVTTMKIPPPINATNTIARGTLRSASCVSSVSALMASNPRNEYAATAAPAASAEKPPPPVNGVVETSDCESPTRWVIDRMPKSARMSGEQPSTRSSRGLPP